MKPFYLPCIVKSATGVECAGCGLQRSFWALIRGDFAESIALYPALIPFLAMLIFFFAAQISKSPKLQQIADIGLYIVLGFVLAERFLV